jgi:hypothetical protein
MLFGLELPNLGNDYTRKLLEQRNQFTHNSGFHNGERIKVDAWDDVLFAYNSMANLILTYSETIRNHMLSGNKRMANRYEHIVNE